MQRVFAISLMLLLAPGAVAQADPIHLGFISFDGLIPPDGEIPGVNGFTIANLTGDPAAGGFGLPSDFPVFSPIRFVNSVLTVVQNGSSTDYLLGDIGPGFFQLDLFPTSAQISSATFVAQLGSLAFTLADGSIWSANSSVLTASLLPADGSFLTAGLDLALLTIEASEQTDPPSSVPEPGTLLLLAGGIAAVAACRMRKRDRTI
jgi:PEP-CTERM motif